MNASIRFSSPITRLAVGAVGLALLAVAAPALMPVGRALAALGTPVTSDDPTASVLREAQVRSLLDFAVVVFQVAGVASLVLARFVAAGRVARSGRLGFVAAMVGLGVAGTLCAWYGSEFALFSGGSMALLLNGVILGAGGPQHPGVATTRTLVEPGRVADLRAEAPIPAAVRGGDAADRLSDRPCSRSAAHTSGEFRCLATPPSNRSITPSTTPRSGRSRTRD